MATLTVQTPALTGAVVTFAAAAGGGDNFVGNDGRICLRIKTGGTVSTVTIDSKTPCDQGTDHNVVIAMAATEERTVGPFPVARFGTQVDISYSAVTALTVAAVRG